MVLKNEKKLVFVDGNLNTGKVRSIRGRITQETDTTITVERSDGMLTIGKNFIIKIEEWASVEGNHGTKG